MPYTIAALEAELPGSEMNDLVTEIVAASLRSIGLLSGEARKIADLGLEKQPAPYYERWLNRSIVHLQQQDLLGDDLVFKRPVRALPELWNEWEAKVSTWASNPNQQAQGALLKACLEGLPAVLSGNQRATEVLFPGSSMHLVEGLYRGNPQADYFNDVLGATLTACIEQQLQADPERRLRILEIGAGTGGTTAALLPLLQRYPVEEYCYTDLSKAFLTHGEKNFAPQFPALVTAIFDVSKPLESQAVAANHYDFAIAANVLHATSDIRNTLRNAKAVLKNRGVLLLNEIAEWTMFNHLTFGLLEGWWLYEDTAVRLPGSPGLSPEKWREILTEEGFESIIFPAEEAHRLGQQIVAAVSNGRTRQRIAPAIARPAPEAAPRPSRAASTAAASEQAAVAHVRRIITAKLSEALRMDAASIQADASFADYGVDSIVGVNLVRTISEALGIELEPTTLFEYSTVDDLTGYVLSNWGEAIAARIPRVESAPAVRRAAVETARSPADERPARAFTGVTRFASGLEVARENGADTPGAEPIAIIGMSGRFAESESLEAFWHHLAQGDDLVKPVSRWSPEDCQISEGAGRAYCSHGSFIDSIDRFDPAFFGLPPLEATYMDPQQRLFLEESWRALEDAGYAGKSVHEKQCGVYVGCGSSQYDRLSAEAMPAQAFWGNSQSVTPARIAYCLNLQGPAITIDTACSSSLVAIHLACQGLWGRETDMALAGGVFLQPTPGFYQVANRAGMLSPDGKCYSFDARANGFVPGEGVGVVVLKRLRDALADGDHVHGVIAGSGINQDGKSNGLIAPNGRAQERLERAVYARFNIDPETIQVVEAHGTGTLLGDSVEMGAISRAFREHTDRKQYCALGTVKTNIGHASTAAGVAGVLKLLLSLKHRQIPPSLHFDKGNPAIDLEEGPFYVNTRLREWEATGSQTRRAAVSSFGFSGTNAHLVIDEAPAVERAVVEAPAYLLVLSARTAEQVKQQARDLVQHLERNPDLSLTDVSFSLFVGRMHRGHRLACIGRDGNDLMRALGQWLETGASEQVHTGEMHEGKFREQVSLKKFGNYCIQECRDARDATAYMENLEAVAELYVQGYALDFPALFPNDARRVPLPTYPFARERYWLDGVGGGVERVRVRAAAPAAIASPVVATRSERSSITPSPRSAFAAAEGDLRALLQSDLTEMVRGLLNLGDEHVAPDKVLIDLGFDSLGLASFARAINDRYQLDITPVLFFDYPSISEIARHLFEEQGTRIASAIARPATPQQPAVIEQPSEPRRQDPAEPRSEPRSSTVGRRFVDEPIAIVGIAGVMPQSEDLDALWANLKDGKDLITVIPRDRWPWEDYYGDPLREVNKSSSKWGGFMKEIDKFDPLFFGISPREAQMMDPQQRIFLETVWKAIEDSGQKVSDLAGTRTGLFVGVGSNDYLDLMRNQSIAVDGYTASGNAHSVLANRVSFLLNLRGPSSPIDTACSSSLVALHRAIESIQSGSSDMAIVGGVQVIMSPGGYISFGMAGMLSEDGKCKTFDKRANGYVRGEGCGAMLLKPLSHAEADGNHIYAVVRATAENHGGRVTTMIAPNSAAQSALLIEAYEKADIDPATVGYIECHGTGTSLGDPIEVQALSKAFSELYARRGKAPGEAPHCGLGTIKPNIGHLETAAGIAGLLKVLLALKHEQIPANVHFEELNPYIRLEGTPFYIVEKSTPWRPIRGEDGSVLPRRAGVSSFGFGGANAHAVIEEYVPVRRKPPAGEKKAQLVVLSAKNENRLLAYVQSMRSYVETYAGDLDDLAYTLQVGRDEMPERLALVVSEREELKRKLDEILSGHRPGDSYRGNPLNGAVDEMLVRTAIERNDLSRLAELWVAGARIEWRRLHDPALPRRISAPTYPFARDRHWLPGDAQKATAPPRDDDRTSLQTFVPAWSPARIEPARSVSVPETAVILLLGSDRDRLDWVRRSYPQADLAEIDAIGDRSFDQLLWIAPEGDEQEEGVLMVFRAIKALLRSPHAERNVQWTILISRTQQVTDGEPVRPAHAGIAGLIGSLAKECPHWSLRLLDVDSLASVEARECLSLPWDKQGNGLALRGGEWFQQALTPAALVPRSSNPSYRRNGVYVVIGGAGGIGEVWSRFMIERYQANVVWIGRRPCDAAIERKIDALSRLGAAPLYIAADATDVDALTQARAAILNVHPAIHGVVHSALVLHDQSIALMEEPAFRSSLSAKVDVAVNLDRVFGNEQLDFMLFFSSIVSFVRPAGQANYSAGCAFKDSFARMLQQQRTFPVKTMNWGYWGSVGVAADDAYRRNMARVGLGSIEPEEGMAALEALMSADLQQVALIKTVNSAAALAATAGPRPVDAGPITADRVRQTIIERLCEELGLQPSTIRHDAALSEYGVDSIVGVNLVRSLSETLGMSLEPSSLFDHGTVDRLTEYIVGCAATDVPASTAGEPAIVEQSDPHGVPPPVFDETAESTIDLGEGSGESLLDALLWEEAASADSYEKVTF